MQAERAAEALETAKQKALRRSNAYDSLVKSNVQVVKVSLLWFCFIGEPGMLPGESIYPNACMLDSPPPPLASEEGR